MPARKLEDCDLLLIETLYYIDEPNGGSRVN
jgi:hypothetical protein